MFLVDTSQRLNKKLDNPLEDTTLLILISGTKEYVFHKAH
jgi:hypothetical protein